MGTKAKGDELHRLRPQARDRGLGNPYVASNSNRLSRHLYPRPDPLPGPPAEPRSAGRPANQWSSVRERRLADSGAER
jgi:hypothetical protein